MEGGGGELHHNICSCSTSTSTCQALNIVIPPRVVARYIMQPTASLGGGSTMELIKEGGHAGR